MIKKFKLYENKDITKSEEFKNWFGDSKIINEDGSPKIMYHGSLKTFDTFDDDLIGSFTGNEGHYGRGFYFADSKRNAKIWGNPYNGSDDNNNVIVYDVYLKMEKPFIVNHSNLFNLGKKYGLNVPDEQPIAIDLNKIVEQLKNIDIISAELLKDIIDTNWEKGWKIFLDKYDNNIPESKIDLNDINDWTDYGIGNYERDVPDFIIEQLDELGIKDYIVYGHKYELQMHYLTDLGQNTYEWTQAIKDDDYDGIIAGDEYVIFDSTHIKSATNNNGNFDSNNPNINEKLSTSLKIFESLSGKFSFSNFLQIVSNHDYHFINNEHYTSLYDFHLFFSTETIKDTNEFIEVFKYKNSLKSTYVILDKLKKNKIAFFFGINDSAILKYGLIDLISQRSYVAGTFKLTGNYFPTISKFKAMQYINKRVQNIDSRKLNLLFKIKKDLEKLYKSKKVIKTDIIDNRISKYYDRKEFTEDDIKLNRILRNLDKWVSKQSWKDLVEYNIDDTLEKEIKITIIIK